MRRLFSWIAILTTCASLILVGFRVAHPDPAVTACVQLLAPDTGDVLTVDATTGAAHLDARHNFPIALPTIPPPYRNPLSPDQTHVLIATNWSEAGPAAFTLVLGKRSTTNYHSLTPASFTERYLWSPDSQHIAFIEMRGWGANGPLVNLAMANVDSVLINREAIAEVLDDGWFNHFRDFVWSPDSSTLAMSMYASSTGATLALRPAQADQSIYVALPNEMIAYAEWSPDSQVIFVFTASPSNTLYVIRRDGQLLKRVPLSPDFSANFTASEGGPSGLRWSSDGHYFFLIGATAKRQVDIFDLNGSIKQSTPLSPTNTLLSWTLQPHTLLYIAPVIRGDHQALSTLDAETGVTRLLIDDIPLQHGTWSAPDSSALAIITDRTPDQFTPRLFSLASHQITTPFGTINGQGNIDVNWSSDSQQLMIVSEDASKFLLHWRAIAGGAVSQFEFPKQGVPQERLSVSWLTNTIALLSHYAGDQRTAWRLDTRSSTLVKLFSLPTSTDYYVVWKDEDYAAIGTRTGTTVYRLSDGLALFSEIPPIGGFITAYVEPHERAVLFFRARDAGSATPALTLITHDPNLSFTSQLTLTRPAWSVDGEMFAFGALDYYGAGWRVKIVSRDGTLLKDFAVQNPDRHVNYDQARWTTCD